MGWKKDLNSKNNFEYFHCVKSVPYSVGMRQNTDQNDSEYGHFSRSAFTLLISAKLMKVSNDNSEQNNGKSVQQESS